LDTQLDVYIAVLGQEANDGALELVQAIRKQGFRAERDYLDRKLKAQFKSADVFGAKAIITLGGSEIESGQVVVKNNQTRSQVETSLEILKTDFASILEELEKQ
ncbi:His/Gly/Thr/Pro-type tRNA ligase C-terminal domain-containing protein, partial [Streptococcus suis]